MFSPRNDGTLAFQNYHLTCLLLSPQLFFFGKSVIKKYYEWIFLYFLFGYQLEYAILAVALAWVASHPHIRGAVSRKNQYLLSFFNAALPLIMVV